VTAAGGISRGINSATGGISAELYGGSFGDGFTAGLKTAGVAAMCNDFTHWMAEARSNREATNKFLSSWTGRFTKFGINKLLPSPSTAVASATGGVTLGQAAKSLLKADMLGCRGIPALGGVSGTIMSAAATTLIGAVSGWISWEAGLYVGSYVESLPALLK